MAEEIELVLDAHAEIGESPTWSAAERALYWIDVKAPALHRFDPANGATRTWRMPDEIGCFALYEDAPAALVALRTGLYRLDLNTEVLTRLTTPPYHQAVHRFNEGACDGKGRFWVGTMFAPQSDDVQPERGPLFRYSGDLGLIPQPDTSLTPNGLAWSPEGDTLYFAHSKEHRIYRFDFDTETGLLGGGNIFAEIPAELGVPDGAAVDAEGCYWSAIHGGSRLLRFSPDGTVNREVTLPVSQPTMCAFAGPDLDTLYVTSATSGLGVLHGFSEPHAGGLFRLKPGVRGVPRHGFAG